MTFDDQADIVYQTPLCTELENIICNLDWEDQKIYDEGHDYGWDSMVFCFEDNKLTPLVELPYKDDVRKQTLWVLGYFDGMADY